MNTMLSILKLRKHLFVFLSMICLVFWTHTVMAQDFKKGDINIGFDGGIQFTNISDETAFATAKSGTGFSLGPYVEYHISPVFKLRFGLQFDNRAYGINEVAGWGDVCNDTLVYYDNSYIQVERDFKINYLTIPLSIVYVKGNDKFKLFVQLSFYYSLYLNAHQKGYNDIYIAPQDYQLVCDSTVVAGHNITDVDEAVESGFTSSDFGLNFYIGGIIKLSPNFGLTISPGFTVGMGNVYDNPNIKSRWSRIFKINAGIVYRIGKD